MSEVTRILQAVNAGECGALAALADAVYCELHHMASRRMSDEQGDAGVLQTTELIHEAWLRLFPAGEASWQNRAHFFGAAAEAMRRVLGDAARHRLALRRGGDRQRFGVADYDLATREADLDLILDVDAALSDLQVIDTKVVEVVKLRYFAGLTNQEAAEVLGIGEATCQRYWAYARAWLYDRISPEQGPQSGNS